MTFDNIESHDTVVSTMDIARARAMLGGAAGTVIMAEYQTGGRGRQGRVWFAPPRANVCLTAIGEPIPAADGWRVALLAGVATAEGVARATDLAASVRFPNDVYVEGRKLGGVLVETMTGAGGYVTPLIGIGVNINVREFPEDLRDRATSTLKVTGREISVGVVTGYILRYLGDRWGSLADGDFADRLLPHWRSLANPDNCRTFRVDGRDLYCRVVDVSADGTVKLEDSVRQSHVVHAAQVILGED